jgi:CTP:molybdopterin cytidylyltransferase MocA
MGRPKPLLDFHGETFLDRQIALYAAVCRPVIVVLGHDAGEIARGAARAPEALIVLNPRPDRGQLSSLCCGLAALPAAAPAFFFTPIDSPGVAPATLHALLAAFHPGAAFVIPQHQGRRGHPVLASSSLISDFQALPQTAAARDLVHARTSDTILVELNDPRIHTDLDTPESYAQFVVQAERSPGDTECEQSSCPKERPRIGDTEGEHTSGTRPTTHPEGTPDLADEALAKFGPSSVDSRECPRPPQPRKPAGGRK